MKIKIKTRIGSTEYEMDFEEKNDMETLHLAAVLGNPRRKCTCDNTSSFVLDSNKDKEGNIYVNVVCLKCYAKSKLGQYKTGGYFWHGFEKYEPKDKE